MICMAVSFDSTKQIFYVDRLFIRFFHFALLFTMGFYETFADINLSLGDIM